MKALNHRQISECFDACFEAHWNTVCRGGAQEPLYRPATSADAHHVLFYREDFAASALHEIAHWCIAGVQRLTEEDFGYTYIAPPRSGRDQERFLQLELRAQSLESVFALAAQVRFVPSLDHFPQNKASAAQQAQAFADSIAEHEPKTLNWMDSPAGARAQRFHAALTHLQCLISDGTPRGKSQDAMECAVGSR